MADFRNEYSSPHVWGRLWRAYTLGPLGAGVAIGDVDGDGEAEPATALAEGGAP